MRKFLVALLATFTLMGTVAFADGHETGSTQWFGVSTGYPVGINLHYGLKDLLMPDLDLRVNVTAASFDFATFSVIGGVDALYQLNLETVDDLPLDVYAGGGLNIGASLGATTQLSLSLSGLAGAEYMLTDELGVYGEARVGLGIPQIFQPALSVGLNFHF